MTHPRIPRNGPAHIPHSSEPRGTIRGIMGVCATATGFAASFVGMDWLAVCLIVPGVLFMAWGSYKIWSDA